MYIVAPQRIRFFDADGRLIRTVEPDAETAIELAGWLDDADGEALLHEYELAPGTDGRKMKVNSQFRWIDIRTGQSRSLRVDPVSAHLKEPKFVRYGEGIFRGEDLLIYVVDRDLGLVSVLAEHGVLLTDPDSGRTMWATSEPNGGSASIHTFDPATGRRQTTPLSGTVYIRSLQPIGGQWLFIGDEMRYLRVE